MNESSTGMRTSCVLNSRIATHHRSIDSGTSFVTNEFTSWFQFLFVEMTEFVGDRRGESTSVCNSVLPVKDQLERMRKTGINRARSGGGFSVVDLRVQWGNSKRLLACIVQDGATDWHTLACIVQDGATDWHTLACIVQDGATDWHTLAV